MNEITEMLSEKIHYEIIPSENPHGWDIRILEEFPETVISFGALEYQGEGPDDEEGYLSYNFTIVSTPDPDLTVEDLTFQAYTGRILNAILAVAIEEGTLVGKDKDTDKYIMTEQMNEDIADEYQSRTNNTEELTDE